MGVYNILSPIFFILLALGIWSHKLAINLVDNLNAAEFILHSVLATIFTGFSLGYQFILFTLAIPIVVQANDKRYLRFNQFRTVLSIGIFIALYALVQYDKIKTPDAVLNKPGKLTPEEFDIIKQHTTDGGKIIRKVFQNIDDPQYEETAYIIAMELNTVKEPRFRYRSARPFTFLISLFQ